MTDFTIGLNPEQTQAVLSESNRILMLAGAGSGKTKTLTHRLAHLNINCRVGVSSIIAITFTRAAAKEMKDRLVPLIGKDAKKLICCTFHALAVQILQQWGHRLGLDRQFTIYSREDREEVICSIIKKGEYRTTYKRMDDAKWLFSKNTQELSVWNEYNWQLKRFNAVDLDYLIPKVVELFTKHPDVAEYYRRIWKYVFTDETQDTDLQQYELIKLLNPVNLFAIGDPKQSIYGFRGARVENILEFTTTFPNTEFIELFRNYRSTKQIVESANNLISHSELDMGQPMSTDIEGHPVLETSFLDAECEALTILSAIQMKDEDKPYSGFAVLARTNAQIEYVHHELRKANIPCVILSGSDDPLKKHDIKFLIAYLDAIFNSKDETNFKRVLNFPEPVITETQLQLLEQISIDESLSLQDAMKHHSNHQAVLEYINRFDMLANFIRGLDTIHQAFRFLSQAPMLNLEGRYKEQNLNNRIEDLQAASQYIYYWQERQLNLGEDLSPQAFLKWVRIRDITEKLMESKDAVKIMTIHGSKGLEFDTVFLIGLNQGVFPHRKSVDIEEDRRVFYVALTRAKRQLNLSSTRESATKWGKIEVNLPSQFIRESRNKKAI